MAMRAAKQAAWINKVQAMASLIIASLAFLAILTIIAKNIPY
jgi:hypothetical protein